MEYILKLKDSSLENGVRTIGVKDQSQLSKIIALIAKVVVKNYEIAEIKKIPAIEEGVEIIKELKKESKRVPEDLVINVKKEEE